MDENENNNQQPAASAAPVSNAPVSKNVSLETFVRDAVPAQPAVEPAPPAPAAPAHAAPTGAPAPAGAPASPAPAGAPAKKSQRKWVVLSILLLLLIAAGIALFLWLTSPDPNRDGMLPDANARVGSLSGDFEDLDKIVDEGMLTFSINVTPSFPDGASPGNLMIENAEINNNRFTCAIYRKDNGEKIYQSGYLDPGQYIESAPLEADLEPGEYPCTAYFETYKLSDNAPIGQAAAEITVYVQG